MSGSIACASSKTMRKIGLLRQLLCSQFGHGDTTRHFYKGGWAWEGLIKDFTSRDITFASDRLPALAGIAKKYALERGETYVLGLWKEWLITSGCASLCWKVANPDEALPFRGKTVPSWSWASVRGAIDFEPEPARWDKAVKLLDCQVRHRGDPYTCNDVESARLVVSGLVFPATLIYGEDLRQAQADCAGPVALKVQDNWLSFFMDYRLTDDGQHHIGSGSEVFCLRYGGQIKSDFPPLLVLRCVDDVKGYYERIGIVHYEYDARFWRRWPSILKEAKEQISREMTIILV